MDIRDSADQLPLRIIGTCNPSSKVLSNEGRTSVSPINLREIGIDLRGLEACVGRFQNVDEGAESLRNKGIQITREPEDGRLNSDNGGFN
ncbi:hypothetical protein AFLA_008082 [Aspergillus flavus NRRL3357]|nr:hypothetical protein AFLA_008082 [Aspergillus flavus NRRL3357]